jgi:hypothetical protein
VNRPPHLAGIGRDRDGWNRSFNPLVKFDVRLNTAVEVRYRDAILG